MVDHNIENIVFGNLVFILFHCLRGKFTSLKPFQLKDGILSLPNKKESVTNSQAS